MADFKFILSDPEKIAGAAGQAASDVLLNFYISASRGDYANNFKEQKRIYRLSRGGVGQKNTKESLKQIRFGDILRKISKTKEMQCGEARTIPSA